MKDPVIAEGRFNYWYPLLRNQGVVRGLSKWKTVEISFKKDVKVYFFKTYWFPIEKNTKFTKTFFFNSYEFTYYEKKFKQ